MTSTDVRLRYNPPPNWPAPPDGWAPGAEWSPDPAWGPAPDGWELWIPVDSVTVDPSPALPAAGAVLSAPELGKRVKEGKARRELSRLSDKLKPGEAVLFFGNCLNFKPTCDSLILTNRRLLGVSRDGSIKFELAHNQRVVLLADRDRQTVLVQGIRGEEMTFKQVQAEDVQRIEEILAALGAAPPDEPDLQARKPGPDLADPVLGKKARKELERAERSAVKARHAADDLARYGRMISQTTFANETVRFYDKGYVRIATPLFGSKAPFEKLLFIQASSDVSTKTGLGRGAGALMTGGLNLLTPNKRGDVYLTIRTDVRTHVLHQTPPTDASLRKAKELEAIGLSMLAARGGAPPADAPAPVAAVEQGDVAERLRQLETLKDQHLVTAEEYDAKRKAIVDSL